MTLTLMMTMKIGTMKSMKIKGIAMDLGYGLFMAEAEGYLDTHESKVQKVLRDVRYRYNMGQEELTINSDYLKPFGLVLGDLTGYDFERIQRVAETGRLR